jgi:hypothetical protein
MIRKNFYNIYRYKDFMNIILRPLRIHDLIRNFDIHLSYLIYFVSIFIVNVLLLKNNGW